MTEEERLDFERTSAALGSTQTQPEVKAIAKAGAKAKQEIAFGPRGVQIQSLEDLFRFSHAVVLSGLAQGQKPEDVLVKIQTGMEIGLPPMRALTQVVVVNGRPSLMGDGALALVRRSGLLGGYEEGIEGEGDAALGHAWAKRSDTGESARRTFSIAEAKRAGLWGKKGPWTEYWQRMLVYRARGFLLRDLFSDVLMGLHLTEEMDGAGGSGPLASPAGNVADAGPDPLLAEVEI